MYTRVVAKCKLCAASAAGAGNKLYMLKKIERTPAAADMAEMAKRVAQTARRSSINRHVYEDHLKAQDDAAGRGSKLTPVDDVKAFRDALIKFLIAAKLPATTVEMKELRDLFETSGRAMPRMSDDTVRRLVTDAAEKKEKQVASLLSKVTAGEFGVSTMVVYDGWTAAHAQGLATEQIMINLVAPVLDASTGETKIENMTALLGAVRLDVGDEDGIAATVKALCAAHGVKLTSQMWACHDWGGGGRGAGVKAGLGGDWRDVMHVFHLIFRRLLDCDAGKRDLAPLIEAITYVQRSQRRVAILDTTVAHMVNMQILLGSMNRGRLVKQSELLPLQAVDAAAVAAAGQAVDLPEDGDEDELEIDGGVGGAAVGDDTKRVLRLGAASSSGRHLVEAGRLERLMLLRPAVREFFNMMWRKAPLQTEKAKIRAFLALLEDERIDALKASMPVLETVRAGHKMCDTDGITMSASLIALYGVMRRCQVMSDGGDTGRADETLATRNVLLRKQLAAQAVDATREYLRELTEHQRALISIFFDARANARKLLGSYTPAEEAVGAEGDADYKAAVPEVIDLGVLDFTHKHNYKVVKEAIVALAVAHIEEHGVAVAAPEVKRARRGAAAKEHIDLYDDVDSEEGEVADDARTPMEIVCEELTQFETERDALSKLKRNDIRDSLVWFLDQADRGWPNLKRVGIWALANVNVGGIERLHSTMKGRLSCASAALRPAAVACCPARAVS